MIDLVDMGLTFDFADLVIRQVEEADLKLLEWGQEYKKYRRMYSSLFRSTQKGKSLMWVVEIPQGEIIGQAFVMLKSSERDAADGESRAYVFAFRVKQPWRNKGIGAYLMHFIEDDLDRRGFKFVTLNVAKDNPKALRLYRRLGYRIIGSRPGIWSYTDNEGRVQYVEEPAWRMMKRLKRD
ncbi:MAG: GNAT family N-acetyltransferase [Chloroflexota bacterium]|jgi:ribosomal protein S18 acetylase RimI-like enzyme|nr:GNAT family N-acetyltransferase [Chloroflexota bacterium]